jgi:hypothetical protein
MFGGNRTFLPAYLPRVMMATRPTLRNFIFSLPGGYVVLEGGKGKCVVVYRDQEFGGKFGVCGLRTHWGTPVTGEQSRDGARPHMACLQQQQQPHSWWGPQSSRRPVMRLGAMPSHRRCRLGRRSRSSGTCIGGPVSRPRLAEPPISPKTFRRNSARIRQIYFLLGVAVLKKRKASHLGLLLL